MFEGAVWTYLPGHLRLSTATTSLRHFCYSQPDNLTNLMVNVPELSRHHLRMWNEMASVQYPMACVRVRATYLPYPYTPSISEMSCPEEKLVTFWPYFLSPGMLKSKHC